MSIKSVVLTVGIIISVVIISALISNYISERNLRSIDLPTVSDGKEKEQQPKDALRSIVDKPAPKVEEKVEQKKIEAEYPEESISDVSYDDALRDIKPEDEDVGESREAEIITGEGPPSPKVVRPLPIFEPIISDTGPMLKDSDKTYSNKLPEATEQFDDEGSSVSPDIEHNVLPPVTPVTVSKPPDTTKQHDYDGPPVPAGKVTKPLPPFTPITNKTGPTLADKNK